MYVCNQLHGNVCLAWVEVPDDRLASPWQGLTQEEGIYLGAQFFLLTLIAWLGGLFIRFLSRYF